MALTACTKTSAGMKQYVGVSLIKLLLLYILFVIRQVFPIYDEILQL